MNKTNTKCIIIYISLLKTKNSLQLEQMLNIKFLCMDTNMLMNNNLVILVVDVTRILIFMMRLIYMDGETTNLFQSNRNLIMNWKMSFSNSTRNMDKEHLIIPLCTKMPYLTSQLSLLLKPRSNSDSKESTEDNFYKTNNNLNIFLRIMFTLVMTIKIQRDGSILELTTCRTGERTPPILTTITTNGTLSLATNMTIQFSWVTCSHTVRSTTDE